MEKLLEILRDVRPDVDFTAEDNLIEGGILDSMDIVNLITGISEEFDVVITARDILPENFNSAAKMFELIKRLREED
ncbi:MAG: acyl carrier protein [Clostridia bacterium]|nr:acyl carrier protein [Clostridia bacterium]MBQ7604261.1 acyl carrier protein [Clostridia bacterium]